MSDNTNKGELFMKLYKLAVERDTLKQQNAELAAQVEAMKNGIHHFNRTRGDLNPLFKAAFDSTPAQCLLEVKAEAGRDGFIAGGAAFGFCLDRLNDMADQYAKKYAG